MGTSNTPDTQASSRSIVRRVAAGRNDLPLIGLAMLTGVAAFVWAGFLANPAPTEHRILIHDPWLLFLWLCLLIIYVQVVILRDTKATLGMRAALLSVTFASILGVILVRLAYFGTPIPGLQWLLNLIKTLGDTFTRYRQLGFALLNLALILLYWAGVWIPRLWRAVDRNSGTRQQLSGEQIAGDFLVGLAVSLVFAPLFLTWTLQRITGDKTLTPCETTWLPALPPVTHTQLHCASSVQPLDLSTLASFDLVIQPPIYLGAALAAILLVGVSNALAARRLDVFAATIVGAGGGVLSRLRSIATWAVQLRIFWPFCVLGAVIAVTMTAWTIQDYLVNISKQWHDCNVLLMRASCGLPLNQNGTIFWIDTAWPNYVDRMGALLTAAIALAATIAGASLLVIRPRADSPSLWREGRFIRLQLAFLGGLLVFSFWFFCVILSIGNWLGLAVISVRLGVHSDTAKPLLWVPFIQPEPITVLSLVACVGYIIQTRRRSAREQKASKTASGGAAE